jgi:predicted nucleic acid-binding protein
VIASAIFLDTVGLLALWDRSDQWHPAAEQAFQDLAAHRVGFYSSSLVFLECANAASRRPYRTSVAALWREMKSAGRVFFPAEKHLEEAWHDYERGAVGGPGVVDLISFQAMRHLGIERAFTNDRHFREAGFQVLF